MLQISKSISRSIIDLSTNYNLYLIIITPKKCNSFFIPLDYFFVRGIYLYLIEISRKMREFLLTSCSPYDKLTFGVTQIYS